MFDYINPFDSAFDWEMSFLSTPDQLEEPDWTAEYAGPTHDFLGLAWNEIPVLEQPDQG